MKGRVNSKKCTGQDTQQFSCVILKSFTNFPDIAYLVSPLCSLFHSPDDHFIHYHYTLFLSSHHSLSTLHSGFILHLTQAKCSVISTLLSPMVYFPLILFGLPALLANPTIPCSDVTRPVMFSFARFYKITLLHISPEFLALLLFIFLHCT